MQDLKKRTKHFALDTIELCTRISKTTSGQILSKQLIRSATSIGANYREADMAHSKADFAAKISICLKEASETTYWLELLAESDLGPRDKLNALHDESIELTKILFTIRKNAKEKF
ncbi:four helix bundle protein [Pelagicoccus sp. SDUM812003]|uniref:four helix bundle protein n=1 Tax=Pelagicoccus sp. SDUM812003 TaxID=3041267 RepID=UPI00280F5FA8|nr:four helix bundle protein [Pelagicoccus sp. SDUM812003]MDQ8205606.1 four helix bundle protein [Pelagicoccus sp. SDUM812003]